jgi:hypothetical protein
MSVDKQIPAVAVPVQGEVEEEIDTSAPSVAQQGASFSFDFSGAVPQFQGFDNTGGQFSSLEEAYAMYENAHHGEYPEEQEYDLNEDALMQQLEAAFAAQLRMQGIEPPENLQEHLLEFLARDMGLMGEEHEQEDGDDGDSVYDEDEIHDGEYRHDDDEEEDEEENEEDEEGVQYINEQDLINMIMQQLMSQGAGNVSEEREQHDGVLLEEVDEEQEHLNLTEEH